MVVGFEVMACSIARAAGEKPKDVSCIDTLDGKPPAPLEITKGMGKSSEWSAHGLFPIAKRVCMPGRALVPH